MWYIFTMCCGDALACDAHMYLSSKEIILVAKCILNTHYQHSSVAAVKAFLIVSGEIVAFNFTWCGRNGRAENALLLRFQ